MLTQKAVFNVAQLCANQHNKIKKKKWINNKYFFNFWHWSQVKIDQFIV